MQHPRPKPGARERFQADESFANDASVSGKSRAPVQAIPECDVEALAYGYGIPPEPALSEIRRLWWRLRLRGVVLPVERRVIQIEGGAA